MNLEEWAKYWDEMEEKHHRFEKTFSVVVTGPSAAILDGKKKRAGQPATRGNYVTNAIMSHEKLPREIQRLERHIQHLHSNIAGLQKLLESGN
jgi:hypothetical protein